MNAATQRIPILQFRAGALPCAVAAREVRAVRGDAADQLPLWRLLGLPPAPASEIYRSGTWVLGLAHGDAEVELLVEGPIRMGEVGAGDVLRRPPTLVLSHDDLVFGFVHDAGGLVVLLDIPKLVELAS